MAMALLIDITIQLNRAGFGSRAAAEFGHRLRSLQSARVFLGDGLELYYDSAEHEAALEARLAEAAELAVTRRRGRPPGRGRARTSTGGPRRVL
jgi:hypothetical protein